MLILLTFFLALFPAVAGNTADEAELNFQLAREAYERGDFDTALFHFMVSNRLSPNRNVTFNIGRTYHALRRYPEAYRWYYQALNSDEPSSARVMAQIQESLDRLRPQVALLRVETDPPGATVYLRRKNLGAVGTTPLEVPLQPSNYNVIVELEGYESVETEQFNLRRPGAVQDITLNLVPIVGQVAVAGEAGAAVHLGTEDGPMLCEIPCTADVPEGQQILYFKKPGFRSLPSLIDVVRGETLEVAAELLPITGTVVVDADEQGALIEIDGRPMGYTPAVLTDVQVGDHTVRISARGYEAVEVPVNVTEDGTVDLGQQMLEPRFTVTAASRFAEEVSEAPASVTLIPREEIRAFGYQSISEAVVGVRGFYRTNDLIYESLGVRGFNRMGDYNNRLLVSIDGHRWNDNNLFGGAYVGSDSLTDLHDVEQIEVVRGPGSVIYGSNATFGVLNIVTNRGERSLRPHAVVTASGDQIRGRVGAGVGDSRRGAWVSVAGLYGPGRTFQFDEYADRPNGGVSEGADETFARTIAGKAWLGDFQIQAAYVAREKEMPTGAFGTNLGDHRNSSNDYRGYIEASYLRESKKTRVEARVGVDTYLSRWYGPYPSEFIHDRHGETWLSGLAQINHEFGDFLSVTAGATARRTLAARLRTTTLASVDADLSEDNDVLNDDVSMGVYSGFGSIDLHPGSVFRLNLGARFDQYDFLTRDVEFSNFNPRGVLILTPGNEIIKLVGGTAFRAPSSYELFYTDGGQSQVVPVPANDGDPPLLAETILSTELEWTHSFSQVLTGTVGAYYNEIDNLIDNRPVGRAAQNFNAEETTSTIGAEAEVRRWWRSGWMFAGQVSWQRTRIGDLAGSRELTNSPVWLASIMGAAPLGPRNTIATKIRGETPRLTQANRLTDGALVWDLTLTGRLERPNVEYGVGIRNLLDWPVFHPGGSAVEIDQLPQLGRNFFATVKTTF